MRKLTGILGAAALTAAFMSGLPAQAQTAAPADDCQKIQGMLQQRQAMITRFTGNSKKRMTAQAACGSLGGIVANGNNLVSLMTTNKDWCRIPDEFINNMKADVQRSVSLRGQACKAATQEAAMLRKQRQAQEQQQSGNAFGGTDAVTGGAWRVPQGAL